MDGKKYEVLDETGCIIATGMSLITALMVMEAFCCGKYYQERIELTLKELDRTEENVSER